MNAVVGKTFGRRYFRTMLSLSIGLLILILSNDQRTWALYKGPTTRSLYESVPIRLEQTISWSECEEGCCEKALQVVSQYENAQNNMVCFDLNFRENREQQYLHLTPFNYVFSHYLSMAQKFFESMSAYDTLSGEIIWIIQDDATIDPVMQSKFTSARVATVGHSVHSERGDISMYTVLVPNFHFIEHDGYSDLSRQAAAISAPFSSLRPHVFWAGSSTGLPCRSQRPCNDTCQDLQRYKLVRQSQEIEWLNFSFSQAIQWCKGDEAELQALNMFSNRSDEAEWMQYRGILDVDGNVDAWGSRWRYSMNSVVFKVKTDYVNHYSGAIVDGVHMIQISEDLTDLKSKTSLITRNDTNTQSYLANIAKNARKTIAAFTLESASADSAQALVKFFGHES